MKPIVAAALSLALASTSLAAGQRLKVDPAQSRIEVQVHATLDSFTAHLTAFEPEIVYDPVMGEIERAALDFRFGDLKTGKAERDREMHEWQQTEDFPSARFELLRLERIDADHLRAHGVLTLHGVAHELGFPVVLSSDQRRLSIDGEATLDTRKFGLKIIRKFALLKVAPEVVVRFHLQGQLDEGVHPDEGGAQ